MTCVRAQQAGVLGKVPSLAEFLAPPAAPGAFAELDAWLVSCMEWASARAGDEFPAAFASGAMHGFIFADSLRAGAALVGALAPSHDSAGRQCPLTFASPVALDSRALARLELAPFLFEGIWALSTEALSAGLRGDLAEMQKLAASVDSRGADLEEASSLYSSWASELSVSELFALLGLSQQAELRLRFFLAAVSPLKAGAGSSLALRAPLGVLGGVGLCFWLDVLRRATAWSATLPTLFWSHDGQDGAALINLGRPPAFALAELWLPTRDRDDVADLTQPLEPELARLLPPLPRALATVISEGGRVADLLDGVA